MTHKTFLEWIECLNKGLSTNASSGEFKRQYTLLTNTMVIILKVVKTIVCRSGGSIVAPQTGTTFRRF